MSAEVGHKVLDKEHPGAADLRPWDAACLRALAQFLGVKPEELRSLEKAER